MTVPIHKDSQQKKSKNTASRCNSFQMIGNRARRGCLQCELFSMTTPHNLLLSHHHTTREQCTHHMSLVKIRKKSPHKLLLSSPSWCPAPSVLVWHILPYCPLERSGASYLLLQICPAFFPSLDRHLWFISFLPNPRSTNEITPNSFR